MSNLTTSQTIKSLQTKQVLAESTLKDLHQELHSIEQKIHKQKKTIASIENSISKLSLTPEVSEHAILQYLVRHRNLDIDNIISMILTPELTNQINTITSGKFPIHSGLTAIVKNKTIVTITK